MNIGLRDPEERYRRRAVQRWVRLVLTLIVIVAAAAVGYQYGRRGQLAVAEAARSDFLRVEEQRRVLEDQLISEQANRRTAETRLTQLQERYTTDVPTGEVAEIVSMVQERIGAGISRERLFFVISSAEEPRDCGDAETKRFVVSTPITRGPDSAVSFGRGTITATAQGQSATNDAGAPFAWFDPTQPVRLILTDISGRTTVAEGPLPLTQSIITGDWEYRFSAIEGNRSFVNITAERCAYP